MDENTQTNVGGGNGPATTPSTENQTTPQNNNQTTPVAQPQAQTTAAPQTQTPVQGGNNPAPGQVQPNAAPQPPKSGLSDLELDALKEVANIGSGNASIALSSVFNKKVNISIPNVKVVNISEVSRALNQDGMVVGISSRIKEGMDGNVFIFLPTNAAVSFVAALKNENIERDILTKEDEEILKKIGSVIYSAYITGIANFFEQKVIFSQPDLLSTIGTTILDSILARLDKNENLLLINISFEVEGVSVKGDFLLVLTITSLSPMLTKLKEKMGLQ